MNIQKSTALDIYTHTHARKITYTKIHRVNGKKANKKIFYWLYRSDWDYVLYI